MKAADNLHHLLKSVSLDGRLLFVNHIVAKIPSHRLRLLVYCPCFGFEIGSNSVGQQWCRLDNRVDI